MKMSLSSQSSDASDIHSIGTLSNHATFALLLPTLCDPLGPVTLFDLLSQGPAFAVLEFLSDDFSVVLLTLVAVDYFRLLLAAAAEHQRRALENSALSSLVIGHSADMTELAPA